MKSCPDARFPSRLVCSDPQPGAVTPHTSYPLHQPSPHAPSGSSPPLDIFRTTGIGICAPGAATTSDAFNARGRTAADAKRSSATWFRARRGRHRRHPEDGEPSVSKDLKVTREEGLVRVRRSGRHMLYRTNADAIRPLHERSKMFEPYWRHQLSRIKERAEAKAKALKHSIKEEKEK